MKVDLSRWPFLLGAVLCVGIGAYLLAETGQAEDKQFAAFVLIVVGAVLVGAFIADRQPPEE